MTVAEVVSRFARHHPKEAARVLEGLDDTETSAFIAQESTTVGAPIVRAMDPQYAVRTLDGTDPAAAGDIVTHLDPDVASGLLRRMSTEGRASILQALPESRREVLETALKYPDRTAGSLMDPRALAIPSDLTLAEGLDRVRRYPARASYYVYVIERTGRLCGVINIRELMIGDPDRALPEAMVPDPVRLKATDGLTTVLAHPAWMDYQVLPVVGEDGRFEGALRHRTLRRLAREPSEAGGLAAGSALGELYQIGLTGLVQMTTPSDTGGEA